MNETIRQIHLQKTGKVSDKWSSYLDYYDRIFADKRDAPINLFEIGIQNGGSLETWAQYFRNARNIIGCDIDPSCRTLRYDDPRIKLIVADANSDYTFNEIKSVCNALDIVIDDGSHRSVDILQSFVTYFQMLRPGGTYIIEDTHTLYWQSWGGELTNKFNAYKFFKKMIDVINYQFWDKEMSIEEHYSDFFQPNGMPAFIKEGWVESIEFRNSIIMITKSKTPNVNGLGERLVTGTRALVNHNVMEHHREKSIA